MENRYLFRGKTLRGDWVQGFLTHKGDEWYISNKAGAPFAYAVRPETICQCTGYEGIYEKDIFEDEGGIFVIKWSEDTLEWIVENICSNEKMSLCEFSPKEIDVIGNEIDNPGLLEV